VVAPSICLFDVNEMLLDIEPTAPLFQRLFRALRCAGGAREHPHSQLINVCLLDRDLWIAPSIVRTPYPNVKNGVQCPERVMASE
jgi:hypothetical protein